MLRIETKNKLDEVHSVKPLEKRLDEGWYNLTCKDAIPSIREKDGAKYYKFRFEIQDGIYRGRSIYASYYPHVSRHKVYINNLYKSFGFSDSEIELLSIDDKYINSCSNLNVRGQLFHNDKYNNLELFSNPNKSNANKLPILNNFTSKQELLSNAGDVLY